MICKRILPCTELRYLIREYLVAEFTFKDISKLPPLRAYPANPEEGIRFLIRGKLFTNNPATGITSETPTISIIGQPTVRQNLQITHEYLMLYVRLQPGSLFKLFHIPMTMLTDQHIDALVGQLKKAGVTITDTIETVEYGRFVHIMDIEGNKIELWEPNDIEFEKLGEKIGAKTTK